MTASPATVRPVRIGILSFAHMHASSYAHCILNRKDTELVGVADHDPERAQQMAQKLGTMMFGSYEALLDNPDLDAVVIGSEKRPASRIDGTCRRRRQTRAV